jgi:hypothetical protein
MEETSSQIREEGKDFRLSIGHSLFSVVIPDRSE